MFHVKQREHAWDAARLASRRPLRKPYKPVGPVGPDVIAEVVRGERPAPNWAGCKGCGHHVCSCKRRVTCVSCNATGDESTHRLVSVTSRVRVWYCDACADKGVQLTPEQRARLGME